MAVNDQTLQAIRALPLHSQCKLMFLQKKKRLNASAETIEIIPVLMLNGINALTGENISRISSAVADTHIGIISTGFDSERNETFVHITGFTDEDQPIQIKAYTNQEQPGDWLYISEQELNDGTYTAVYPRILINSLGLKTDSNQLIIKYYDKTKSQEGNINNTLSTIQQYKDYSILSRALNNEYLLTLDNDLLIKNNYTVEHLSDNSQTIIPDTRPLKINYVISNADLAIYLDALEVAKENAQPKVSYTIKPELINNQLIDTLYNKMGYIAHINDNDLKFKQVRGYISGFTLNLDSPNEDEIEIKNYKTKFEDLFSTITAQTETMKKTSFTLDVASTAFTSSGTLSQEVLQSSIKKVDLDYAFNNGKLTIDEKNGIWGTSDNGVVAFRGGGIFTATEKNTDDTWKWNTGITPQGINADMITSGQLDTNLIKIYAGDHLRFQMNGDGIFAYKSKTSNVINKSFNDDDSSLNLYANDSLDGKQYVVFNDNGLSLIAKKGALVLKNNNQQYYEVLNDKLQEEKMQLINIDGITRVEISWDGFILRNWENEKVFYADPQTGNLTLKGEIQADKGHIGTWRFDHDKIWSTGGIDKTTGAYKNYVVLNAGGSEADIMINDKGEPLWWQDDQKTVGLSISTKDYCFWAGNGNPQEASFSIQKSGYMSATSGKIGGWTISSNKLESDAISLSTIYVSVNGQAEFSSWTPGSGDDTGQSKPIYNENYSSNALIWTHGTGTKEASHSTFQVNTSGEVLAQDFYFLTNDSSSGKIISCLSIKSKLNTLSSQITDAQKTATSAKNLVKDLRLSYDSTTAILKLYISSSGEVLGTAPLGKDNG